jgi:hypothetical protein
VVERVADSDELREYTPTSQRLEGDGADEFLRRA